MKKGLRPIKEKVTKLPGASGTREPHAVSSFVGTVNNRRPQPYIKVETDNDWLSLSQARRLVGILQRHIERLEVHTGTSLHEGSRRPAGRKSSAKSFDGYSDKEVHAFVRGVESLAREHFKQWSHDYKWKVRDGRKTSLLLDFELWQGIRK